MKCEELYNLANSIVKLNKVYHVKCAEAEQESCGVPVVLDLVEEAKSAIGIKEARRALLKAKIERGDA